MQRRTCVSESGQMLLVAVLLLAVLLISIPVMIFMNNSTSRLGMQSVKKQKSTSVALEGVAYAIHVLASTPTWSNALAGTCPPDFVDEYGHPIIYKGPSGSPFSIQCISGNPPGYTVQRYEVELLIHGGIPDPATGKPNYGRAYKVVIGQKTQAAVLSSGLGASVALQLGKVPSSTDGLLVHWGSIGVMDFSTWTVRNAIDSYRFPRKFSQGPITGDTTGGGDTYLRESNTGSDAKEYWENVGLGFQNFVDTNVYVSSATQLTDLSLIPATAAMPIVEYPAHATLAPSNCKAGLTCGYFDPPPVTVTPFSAGTAIFGSLNDGSNFVDYKPNTVIYVHGNARFEDIFMDLKNGGAFIVDGDLTLGPKGSHGIPLNVRLPQTAALEYPYYSSTSGWPTAGWPCKSIADTKATYCASVLTGLGTNDNNGLGNGGGDGRVDFRGFLYVKGDMRVLGPGWLLAGSVRVDGTLFAPLIGGRPTLTILYDDEINHATSVNPLELMVNYQKECIPCSF
jgi:hypothetical protein